MRGDEPTATAVSTRMQQANVVLKEPVHNLREGVIVPIVQGYFEWNKLYGDPEAVGDMSIKVEDMKTLMARDQLHVMLENLAVATANPLDAPHVDRNELNRARFEAADLDSDRFVKKPEVMRREQEAIEEQHQQGAAAGAEQPGTEDRAMSA